MHSNRRRDAGTSSRPFNYPSYYFHYRGSRASFNCFRCSFQAASCINYMETEMGFLRLAPDRSALLRHGFTMKQDDIRHSGINNYRYRLLIGFVSFGMWKKFYLFVVFVAFVRSGVCFAAGRDNSALDESSVRSAWKKTDPVSVPERRQTSRRSTKSILNPSRRRFFFSVKFVKHYRDVSDVLIIFRCFCQVSRPKICFLIFWAFFLEYLPNLRPSGV